MTDDRTDAFESAVQQIARRKNGDTVTTDDLWDLIIAVDKDGQTRDVLKLRMIETLSARLEKVENYVEDSQKTCKQRIENLIDMKHSAVHTDHLMQFHSPEKERMTWLVDATAVKLGSIFWLVLGGLLMALISYLVWGTP